MERCKNRFPLIRKGGRPKGLSAVIYGGLLALSRQKVLCPEQGCNTMLPLPFSDKCLVGNARQTGLTEIYPTVKEGGKDRSRTSETGDVNVIRTGPASAARQYSKSTFFRTGIGRRRISDRHIGRHIDANLSRVAAGFHALFASINSANEFAYLIPMHGK
jgi:hypothetical protein